MIEQQIIKFLMAEYSLMDATKQVEEAKIEIGDEYVKITYLNKVSENIPLLELEKFDDEFEELELDAGTVTLKGVMIDVDGYNLEDGVDVYYDGKYAFCIVGVIDTGCHNYQTLEKLNDYLDNFITYGSPKTFLT